MILKRLILENHRLFAGHHEFDLEPRIKYGAIRPIILYGGKNAAGKTTFLSAIQLAFMAASLPATTHPVLAALTLEIPINRIAQTFEFEQVLHYLE